MNCNTTDIIGEPPAIASRGAAPLPVPPPDAPLARLLTYNMDLTEAMCAMPGQLVVNVHDLRVALAALLVRRVHPGTVLVASLAGTVGGRYGHQPDGWFSYLAGIERDLVAAADLIAVPGQAHLAEVAERLAVDPARIVNVGIGIDLPPGPVPGPARDPARVLYVGRLASEKGVFDLLDALQLVRARRPEVTLHVVGDGPLNASVRARIAQAGLSDSVHLAGWLEEQALWNAYAAAAVCVVPSRYDPYPAVIPEALAAGCAVVGCRTGGIVELLDDGRLGSLVPVADPAELSDAIVASLASPPDGESARRARTWVEDRFSWAAFAARTAAAFEQACHAGSHR